MNPTPHTLRQLIQVCQSALTTSEEYEGHTHILSHLQHALMEDSFIGEFFGDSNWTGKRIIYRDPEMGFCIRAHINCEQLNHPPHDHGPTWAIYGQAAGETEMSEWLHIEPPGCN
ncbi:hypothetical protein M3P05_13505 [Sansalvadorimonas sp. 2012CJ34-2]|uniref:Uncharacterized protein n=1 Tax=Parendozoicomonas callyspongiae TaxID=2942213 RepID=A0ABT0PIW2_9GAMM|nr:hypothetical protein [Sansalvadorimonas sp. 2012CJ34-2]MCL6270941.1 hypothetical protein [Sansalvadorimonas sp. 2012CJ34-2]